VPKRKRVQREHTEDWQTIQQYTLWPEQTAYELLRPIVLYGDPAVQRAKETGEARNTLERKADAFDEQGMVSLFASKPRKQTEAQSLPPDMRQLIVDLHVELPSMSLREIADICEDRFNRKPSHHTVQLVLATGPPPSIQTKRYQSWEKIADPAERRLAVVRLHAEGWFAHRERRDNRHSPQDVLRGVLARTVEASTFARIFFATHFTRHLNQSGYLRFRRWRISAEAGRARAISDRLRLHEHARDPRIRTQSLLLSHDGVGGG
jgi:hypothetical protein